jgi:hypothetical protein
MSGWSNRTAILVFAAVEAVIFGIFIYLTFTRR